MPIKYLNDITMADAEVLVIPVSGDGNTGKGASAYFMDTVSKEVRDSFRRKCERSRGLPVGSIDIHFEDGKAIIFLVVKPTYTGKTDLGDVRRSLSSLVRFFGQNKRQSIAIPPIGANDGSLDYGLVHEAILEALEGPLEAGKTVYLSPLGGGAARRARLIAGEELDDDEDFRDSVASSVGGERLTSLRTMERRQYEGESPSTATTKAVRERAEVERSVQRRPSSGHASAPAHTAQRGHTSADEGAARKRLADAEREFRRAESLIKYAGDDADDRMAYARDVAKQNYEMAKARSASQPLRQPAPLYSPVVRRRVSNPPRPQKDSVWTVFFDLIPADILADAPPRLSPPKTAAIERRRAEALCNLAWACAGAALCANYPSIDPRIFREATFRVIENDAERLLKEPALRKAVKDWNDNHLSEKSLPFESLASVLACIGYAREYEQHPSPQTADEIGAAAARAVVAAVAATKGQTAFVNRAVNDLLRATY
jgi:hypothetical protein